jgi:hypothetical protein
VIPPFLLLLLLLLCLPQCAYLLLLSLFPVFLFLLLRFSQSA